MSYSTGRGMGAAILTRRQANRAMGWTKAKRRDYWDARAQECTEMGDEGACLAQVARHVPVTIAGLGSGGGVAVPQAFNFEVVVSGEPRGEYLYEDLSEALDAAAAIRHKSGRDLKIVSPVGSENVVADLEPGTGRPRMLHGMGAYARSRRLRKPGAGLGSGILTDTFCNRPEYADAWRRRLNAGLDAAAVAAVGGGVAAGLLGGFIGRPLISAAIGAALGYGAHVIWAGPFYQPR